MTTAITCTMMQSYLRRPRSALRLKHSLGVGVNDQDGRSRDGERSRSQIDMSVGLKISLPFGQVIFLLAAVAALGHCAVVDEDLVSVQEECH